MARATGLFAAFRSATRSAVRILTYHGVDENQDPLLNVDRMQVEPRLFRRHLETVAKHGRVVPLSEILEAWAQGRRLPPRATAITFDDGYLNNVEIAAPILRDMGLPATFFIATGFLDGRARPWWYELRAALAATRARAIADPLRGGVQHGLGGIEERRAALLAIEPSLIPLASTERAEAMRRVLSACDVGTPALPYALMDWADVSRLSMMGFELGSHTVTHISLRHEEPGVAVREVVQAAEELRQRVGCPVRTCAYPYGLMPREGTDWRAELRRGGLACGVTTVFGLNRVPADLFALRRLDVTGGRDVLNLASLISGFTVWVSALKNRGHVFA